MMVVMKTEMRMFL